MDTEMMTAVAARELRDGEIVFVGVGLPNLACNLARATHAPNLVLVYESGAVGAVPDRVPVSIGDPALAAGALMVCGMADVFQFLLQRCRIDVGFLGGAQIDRFAHINTTVIGDYARPRVRLPGSGGAPEIAAHARRTLVIARLDARAFPERVDFVTSVGGGPVRVITDQCVLVTDPDGEGEQRGELVLAALYPGVTIRDVQHQVGWPLRVRTPLECIEPPSDEVLRLLRTMDAERRYLR